MNDRQLYVKVICSHCGFPQSYDVPVMKFNKEDKDLDDHPSHYNTCTHCHKWIIEFEIEEIEEEEKEEKPE